MKKFFYATGKVINFLSEIRQLMDTVGGGSEENGKLKKGKKSFPPLSDFPTLTCKLVGILI